MRVKRISAVLLSILASQSVAYGAPTESIIQKGGGEFYMVPTGEADKLFNSNNFGYYAIPPSLNAKPSIRSTSVKRSVVRKKTVSKPVVNKPVTTVESAESIFLRLESKNK
ncbi:TPA: hypothetical protein N5N91_004368 [Enterobacter roggenkampii]|nr:hypothetical protein [Enterobacter roggenkampii]